MIKQNPFSLYDFLGYLIPGAVCFFFLFHINQITSLTNLKELLNLSIDYEIKADGVTFFVIAAYILGHIASFLSSITIERYSIWRYGFPSKFLLDIKHKGFWKSAKIWTDFAWRIILILLFFPLLLFDFLLGKILNFRKFYQQSIDKSLQDLIVHKANILLNKRGYKDIPEYKNNAGILNNYDFHRILAHYAYENSKNHQFKLSNYVALYGFLRTLCFIFSILSSFYFIQLIVNFREPEIFYDILKPTLILSTFSYILFMAFMKFYRRYSLECLMVTAIMEDE